MSAPLRVAVVGLGYWGPNLLRNLVEIDGCRSRHDLRPARPSGSSSSSAAIPFVETTSSYLEVVDDDRVDAVVIATPVSTHFDLASRALQFGKHVFVEKPLAASSEEAAELMRLARRAGPHADAGSHVPLQPTGRRHQGADRLGRSGRPLLHLVEPRQPGPAPARRQRRLGSRPPRLLDPALLARRVADHGLGDEPRLRDPGHP